MNKHEILYISFIVLVIIFLVFMWWMNRIHPIIKQINYCEWNGFEWVDDSVKYEDGWMGCCRTEYVNHKATERCIILEDNRTKSVQG